MRGSPTFVLDKFLNSFKTIEMWEGGLYTGYPWTGSLSNSTPHPTRAGYSPALLHLVRKFGLTA